MAKSIFDIASKSIDDQAVQIAQATPIGKCINYDGSLVSAAGSSFRGITQQESIKSGEFIRTAVMGTCGAQVGEAVSVGTALTPDSQGRLVAASSGQFIFARALQVAQQADDYIEIFITREGKA